MHDDAIGAMSAVNQALAAPTGSTRDRSSPKAKGGEADRLVDTLARDRQKGEELLVGEDLPTLFADADPNFDAV